MVRREPWRVPSTLEDIAARDDAHLQSLGIKPELGGPLGFLSNFAIAFSFISVSTGIVRELRGRHRPTAGPAFFWSWPIVIIGQFIVALVFAELASHFPVAGSIYQWSKRLSNRRLGWFTGWFYFWAQVVTVTAVAVIVAYVIDGIMQAEGFLDSPDPTGLDDDVHVHRDHHARHHRRSSTPTASGCCRDAQQHRGRDRDPRDVVFALILLFFANTSPPSILLRHGAEAGDRRQLSAAAFALGMFMSLFIVYGFDTAGTFGEETIDAEPPGARGVLWSVIISGDRRRRSSSWP